MAVSGDLLEAPARVLEVRRVRRNRANVDLRCVREASDPHVPQKKQRGGHVGVRVDHDVVSEETITVVDARLPSEGLQPRNGNERRVDDLRVRQRRVRCDSSQHRRAGDRLARALLRKRVALSRIDERPRNTNQPLIIEAKRDESFGAPKRQATIALDELDERQPAGLGAEIGSRDELEIGRCHSRRKPEVRGPGLGMLPQGIQVSCLRGSGVPQIDVRAFRRHSVAGAVGVAIEAKATVREVDRTAAARRAIRRGLAPLGVAGPCATRAGLPAWTRWKRRAVARKLDPSDPSLRGHQRRILDRSRLQRPIARTTGGQR